MLRPVFSWTLPFLFLIYSCDSSSEQQISQSSPIWAQSGEKYTFHGDHVSMTVNPSLGGRITSFTLDGTEILHTTGEMSGSTFWTSPQSSWGWPPPVIIDNAPYMVKSASSSTLILESNKDDKTGFQIRKTFSADTAKDLVTISYTIINASGSEQMAAPWEITRVPPRGLTFFPKGTDIELSSNTLTPTVESDYVWFAHAGEHDKKLFRDGRLQWIAHLSGNILLVKKYSSDISQAEFAPKESEIEIYAASSYVEVEQQGEYKSIGPGQEITWSVIWSGVIVNNSVNKNPGSTELVEIASAQAGQGK